MAEKMLNKSNVPARAGETETPATRESSRFLSPAIDIYETQEGLVVVADVPGLKKEDLDIEVENGVLTIHGKMSWRGEGEPLTQEFALYDYFRQFTLSDAVDQDRIVATLEKGVLKLTLPKMEHAKPRRIEIKNI
jgi:HSP20 family molecular chaperone IbpA